METRKRPSDATVDNILQELKEKSQQAPKANDRDLDDILSQLGKPGDERPQGGQSPLVAGQRNEARPAAVRQQPASPPTPAASRQEAARPMEPGQSSKKGVEGYTNEQAEAIFQAIHGGEKAQDAISGPAKGKAEKVQKADAFAEGDAAARSPRTGKAAALDRVDRDKFKDDPELTSWFSGAELLPSRREMKQAAKERRQQEAADKRERRRGRAEEPEMLEFEEVEEAVQLEEHESIFVVPPPSEDDLVTGTSLFDDTAEFTPRKRSVPPEAPRAEVRSVPPLAAARPEEVKPTQPRNVAPSAAPLPAQPRGTAPPKPPAFRPTAPEPEPEKPRVVLVEDKLGGRPGKNELFDFVQETSTPYVPPAQGKKGPQEILLNLGAKSAARAGATPGAEPRPPAPPPAGVKPQFRAGPPVQPIPGAPVLRGAQSSPQATMMHGEKPAVPAAGIRPASAEKLGRNTLSYDLGETEGPTRVPTAAFTQEFDKNGMPLPPEGDIPGGKSLFLDEMVDDRFREFFSETVIVDQEEERSGRIRTKRKGKRSRTTGLFTGEFSKVVESAEPRAAEADDEDDYNHPQDAAAVEKDLADFRTTLVRRASITGILGLLLLWMGLAYDAGLPVPAFIAPAGHPMLFSVVYILFIVAAVVLNFTTIASGLVGLFGEATPDSAPALAAVAALLQGVVFLVQMVTQVAVEVTLFGGVAVLLLAFNVLGKLLRSISILKNFQLASAEVDHQAGYVLDGGQEVAYNITKGLDEGEPALLVSRPTTLVKGFLRQSFSPRWSDAKARLLAWVVLGVALLCGLVAFVQAKELATAVSAFTAVFCIAVPLSSTLLSAIPSLLLQQGTSKVGAVVPGWSAIEDLGRVNVVMADASDLFPPNSVRLRGIKTFEKERIDHAILYAASVLVEGSETLRNIFLAMIQDKSEMLYKVENLMPEPGRGFTAWVENNRVVIGNREMLKKYDIAPPALEMEMKYVEKGYAPVYLAVAGRLFAMFIVGYAPNPEVDLTIEGLIKSGVSLLVKSDDMNVTKELIERVYQLPEGVVKVLGRKELDLLDPLTSYLPESEGAMTHIGSFTSFIGGLRAAAGCAASEVMSTIVQLASVGLACLLCLLLVFSGSLAATSIAIVVLYQLGWTVLISALPFARRY